MSVVTYSQSAAFAIIMLVRVLPPSPAVSDDFEGDTVSGSRSRYNGHRALHLSGNAFVQEICF